MKNIHYFIEKIYKSGSLKRNLNIPCLLVIFMYLFRNQSELHITTFISEQSTSHTAYYDKTYFYYKVIDGSGQITHNLSSPYIYLFDKSGPTNPVTNFDDYDVNKLYNSVELTITYTDTYM